jgi:hypothetical protein
VVYPNPTADVLQFKNIIGTEKVLIYNCNGALVLTQQVKNNSIKVATLASGIYFAYILGSNNTKQIITFSIK